MANTWKVYWDNGNHACGVFPYVFETEAEAQAFADEWSAESNMRDRRDPESEDCYSAEPVPHDMKGGMK